MQNQTVQVRVTLPVQLQGLLQAKTQKYGLNISAYIRNLIINDVKDVEYPVFDASQTTEKSYQQAMDERKDALVVDNVEEFFDNL